MASKIWALLGSIRFWILTLTAVLAVLQGAPLVDTVQLWGIAVAGVGTLDSVASKIGGK